MAEAAAEAAAELAETGPKSQAEAEAIAAETPEPQPDKGQGEKSRTMAHKVQDHGLNKEIPSRSVS